MKNCEIDSVGRRERKDNTKHSKSSAKTDATPRQSAGDSTSCLLRQERERKPCSKTHRLLIWPNGGHWEISVQVTNVCRYSDTLKSRRPDSRSSRVATGSFVSFSSRRNLLLKKPPSPWGCCRDFAADARGTATLATRGKPPAQTQALPAAPTGAAWQSSSHPLTATTTYPDVLSTKFSCLTAPPEPLAGRVNR